MSAIEKTARRAQAFHPGAILSNRREDRSMRRKWLAVALLVVSTAPACDPANGNDSAPRVERTRRPTESRSEPVLAAFGVTSAVPDTKLESVDAEAIDVGRGKVGIFAIGRPSVPTRCIVAAQLRLYVEKASEVAEHEVAIYPSLVFDAADKREGSRFGYAGSVLDIRPRATLDEDPVGWSAWDVADILKLWLRGGPFPSMGRRAPRKGPIVLTMRDVDGAEPFGHMSVVSSDASTNTPRMVVTSERDCP
jgi:hypothetical protein